MLDVGSFVRILSQKLKNESVEPNRITFRDHYWFLMLDVRAKLLNVLSFKRKILGSQVIKATPQRPNVDFESVWLFSDKLRS